MASRANRKSRTRRAHALYLDRGVYVVSVDDPAEAPLVEPVGAAPVAQMLRAAAADAKSTEALIEGMLPDAAKLPTPAAVLQARRNSEARWELLREFGGLTSAEVADIAGSTASNRAALANRWKMAGQVLSIPYRDQVLFPAFQFSDGRPLPVIASILEELRGAEGITDWQIALWFTSPNGWLGGRRPVDLLEDDAEAVVGAAARERELVT